MQHVSLCRREGPSGPLSRQTMIGLATSSFQDCCSPLSLPAIFSSYTLAVYSSMILICHAHPCCPLCKSAGSCHADLCLKKGPSALSFLHLQSRFQQVAQRQVPNFPVQGRICCRQVRCGYLLLALLSRSHHISALPHLLWNPYSWICQNL